MLRRDHAPTPAKCCCLVPGLPGYTVSGRFRYQDLSRSRSLRGRLAGHNGGRSTRFSAMVGNTTPGEVVPVDSLRPGTTGLNLVVKVLDAKEVMNKKRPDGSSVRIVECTVGDASGVILFSAKNKQQVETMKVGTTVRVHNGKIDMIRGTMRLAVDQWGLLKEESGGEEVLPNRDNNLSLVEYELVASTDLF